MEELKKNFLEPYEKQINPKDRKKIISSTIKELRKSKGYGQKFVAEQLGIPLSTYSGYEQGNNEPPAEMIVRLSFLYNIPTDFVIGRDVFFIENKEALKQIATYEKLIKEMQADLEKSPFANNEQMQAFIDNMQKLTDAVKEQVKNSPISSTEKE